MGRKPIITGSVVIAILLLGSILFIGTRPSPTAITVRHVNSLHSGDSVTSTFEITNHRTSRFWVYPISGEVRNGVVWKKCFDFSYLPIASFLDPHEGRLFTFYMTNLPTGSSLRLRLATGETLTGLKARLAYFRWSLVKHEGLQDLFHKSLQDLFKKNFSFGQTKEIVSDEFVVQPSPVVEGASDK